MSAKLQTYWADKSCGLSIRRNLFVSADGVHLIPLKAKLDNMVEFSIPWQTDASILRPDLTLITREIFYIVCSLLNALVFQADFKTQCVRQGRNYLRLYLANKSCPSTI